MKEQQGVQSVEVGMRLMRVLAAHPPLATLKELAAAAAMPAAKAHRYLVSLIRAGMVEQDHETARYRLGPAALEVGLAALAGLDVLRFGGETLAALRAEIDETVMLAVWGNRGPTVVRWEDSSRPLTVNVRPGFVMPLLTSSTGRTFTAFLPERQTRGMIAAELAGNPDLAGRWRETIAATRAHGLGRVDGDLLHGVSALSAPIFNHQDEIIAVLSAVGPQGIFDNSWDGPTAAALRAAAAGLSARLGHLAVGRTATHGNRS